MSAGGNKTWSTITPPPHGQTMPTHLNSSAGFLSRKRSPNPFALLFSVIVTGAFIGMILLVSGVADRVRSVEEALTVIPLVQIPADDSDPPKEKPVDMTEVIADSAEESSPSSRPRTIAPAPALPALVPVAVDLAPVMPQVPVPDKGLKPIGEATSKGELAQGPVGAGGTGGDGVAGDGSGGAGKGRGQGSRLIASWAPSMDFSQNHHHYPPSARRAGVEGMVVLDCFVLPRDRVRDCKLVDEKPAGYGFGKAVLRTEAGLRIRVHNQAGRRVYGERVNVISHFVLPTSETGVAKVESKTEDDKAQP